MEDLLINFPIAQEIVDMDIRLKEIKTDSLKYISDNAALQNMFSAIDLTTLSTSDSAESVRTFVEKVNSFAIDYPQLRNVGGICVYPVFAPVLKQVLKRISPSHSNCV